MVKFRRQKKARLKFHGPNQPPATDPVKAPGDKPSPPVKSREKSNKPAKCGEKADCPLRTKCKAGICPI